MLYFQISEFIPRPSMQQNS